MTTNTSSQRLPRRIQADQEELADRIARALPRDGTVEPQPGLHFRRHSRPTEPVHVFAETAFCAMSNGCVSLRPHDALAGATLCVQDQHGTADACILMLSEFVHMLCTCAFVRKRFSDKSSAKREWRRRIGRVTAYQRGRREAGSAPAALMYPWPRASFVTSAPARSRRTGTRTPGSSPFATNECADRARGGTIVHTYTVAASRASTRSPCPAELFPHELGPRGSLLAWETKGQIHWTRLDSKGGIAFDPIAAPDTGTNRKHPAIVGSAPGRILLAWTEGTSWNKGGSIAWQVFDPAGRPVLGEAGRASDLPAWRLPAVFSRSDGGFAILY